MSLWLTQLLENGSHVPLSCRILSANTVRENFFASLRQLVERADPKFKECLRMDRISRRPKKSRNIQLY